MPQSKYEIVTTPKGRLIYPHIIKPDTKFDPQGVYDTQIVLMPSEALDILLEKINVTYAVQINTVREANPKKQIKTADYPYKDEIDEDGNTTGNTVLHAKLKAVGKNGDETWAQYPAIFDALCKPIKDKEISAWSGTIARISFHIVPFYTALAGAGVSLRLKAVQIINLVEGGDQTAKYYGFDEEKDGYQHEVTPPANEAEAEDDLPF